MKSGLSFLVAARRCEIDELERLAHTSELVGAIGRLVHALQRERGVSNVLLGSQGRRFAAQRIAQVAESLRLEHDVRSGFDALEAQRQRHGARLFSRIAGVLPGLDALPTLRKRIAELEIDAATATAAYIKLIAGLLAVVFEAADGATDPEISRALAAMFNFMQAKEFAGQERACGARAFAAGQISQSGQEQWLQLIASQERCFQIFTELAGPGARQAWVDSQPAAELADIERLRRIACARAGGAALDSELSAIWFDCCTLRIDAMQSVEEGLCAELRALCMSKVAQAQAEAESNQTLLARLADSSAASAAFFDADDGGAAPTAAVPYGHQLERSVLDMLQEQSRRLQLVSEELETVRETLNERKLVERAKGLLMAHRHLSEDDAHKMLRQTAMNQNRRLVDVAESVLAMAEYLPDTAARSA